MQIDLEKIRKEKSIKDLLQFSIINLDKPSGPTSFGVDTIIKKELNLPKTSHFGTLDPMVTGVLPIALSRACRLMNYFIGKNKTYVGIMRIHSNISIAELKQEIKPFLGEITQLPPIKSRVKRQERKRTIYNFKMLEKRGKDILFETEVQAGTYIRKLIHDLGEKIGGAHMLELRRTQASIFKEKESIKIYEFLEAVEKYKKGDDKKLRDILIPGEIIKEVLPIVQIKKEYLQKLHHGFPIIKEYLLDDIKNIKFNEGEKIVAFQNQTFIGIYEITNNKGSFAKPEFILQPVK